MTVPGGKGSRARKSPRSASGAAVVPDPGKILQANVLVGAAFQAGAELEIGNDDMAAAFLRGFLELVRNTEEKDEAAAELVKIANILTTSRASSKGH